MLVVKWWSLQLMCDFCHKNQSMCWTNANLERAGVNAQQCWPGTAEWCQDSTRVARAEVVYARALLNTTFSWLGQILYASDCGQTSLRPTPPGCPAGWLLVSPLPQNNWHLQNSALCTAASGQILVDNGAFLLDLFLKPTGVS